MSKSTFVRSLQVETKALSPFDISQRLRQEYGCVSIYKADPNLDIAKFRGYMIRSYKEDRSPENPEVYICVISTLQSKPYQDLTWTKEILHILDAPSHRTDSESLGHMLDNRETTGRTGNGTPPNVMADKNGVTLALGCMVPRTYRNSLRTSGLQIEQLEGMLSVPQEYIPWLLFQEFEADFEAAVAECDS